MDVPATLRTWFVIHFAIDVAAALPLLLFPVRALALLGWTCVDPVSPRLCGAALMAIGVASLTTHKYGVAGYRAMLSLKIVWSLSAIFALLAGIAGGAPQAAWAFLAIFIALSGIWISYSVRLRQLANAPADDDPDDDQDQAEEAGGNHPPVS